MKLEISNQTRKALFKLLDNYHQDQYWTPEIEALYTDLSILNDLLENAGIYKK